ncbi:MAG: helix-hairpin-helix domain-containing protein [Smithellaceae bacterium]|nr:helix-hairpin-helix domain-containing protein [Smithellaceae bacterium]
MIVVTDRQLLGFVSVVAIALIIYGINLTTPSRPGGVIPSYGDISQENVVVELTGGVPSSGIYSLPLGSDLQDLADATGLINIKIKNNARLKLQRGEKYNIEKGYLLKTGAMLSSKKLSLGLTLDINEATEEDLILIPQIGKKTAQEIIRFRQARGRIAELEDLKNIKGIKEKRLYLLRKYLHAGELAGEAR